MRRRAFSNANQNALEPMEEEENKDEEEADTDEEEEKERIIFEKQPPKTEIIIILANPETEKEEMFRCLLDSGTSRSLGTKQAIARAGLQLHIDAKIHKYNTAAGEFTTTHYARIKKHRILELNQRRVLQQQRVRVAETQLGEYDFIFGRDYMTKYGMKLDFGEKTIEWDGIKAAMKHSAPAQQDAFANVIKDNTYAKQDLDAIAAKQTHLSADQRKLLATMLHKHAASFEGKLGTWKGPKISAQLRPDAKPFHCGRPMRVPHIH